MNFSQIALDLISALGYAGMATGLVLDSFGIPIPSEILLAVGGMLAAQGTMNWLVVLVLGTLAQLVGGMVGYVIGRYGGYPFLAKYGKYFLISQKDLDKTQIAFDKYGPLLTMAGRCLPVIRGLVAYPAGIAQMKVGSYVLYSLIGSFVWSSLWVWLGFTLREHFEDISHRMNQVAIVLIAVVLVYVLWHVRERIAKLFKKMTKSSATKG